MFEGGHLHHLLEFFGKGLAAHAQDGHVHAAIGFHLRLQIEHVIRVSSHASVPDLEGRQLLDAKPAGKEGLSGR